MFEKILIANRGEIACRVIRTARTLGYRTVAVYSDADGDAPHVQQADEAVHIGGAAAADSYLRIDALLDAARKTGADAVHPGYGFLSENAGFAQACADAGLVFIGPPASAIQAMGDKALAKRRMIEAGVPCAPGYLGEDQGEDRLHAEALELGLPLLVKAVAGGGGRGMRLVREAGEIEAAIAGARREAQSAFGDGTLMLERLVENGRHIEIQVFADAHGNAVHLGERDCTAQRRRQKVIEEAPSPVVSPAMREAMGRDAVAAALAVGYRGAGTVEFIVDDQLKHYFLEMNTRLQVEHPVTEAITGFDLVEWQLRVAAGDPLPMRQEDIRFQGHAIEARLYAEDPYAGFAPQAGTVRWWRPQQALHGGVRIDDGIREGGEVTPFYDPMVAKVIAHGRDREDAIRRLRAALADAPLLGLRNNARFLSDLLDHPAFRGAAMTTTLIDRWLDEGEALLQRPQPDAATWCLAAAALALREGAGWRADSVAAFDLPLQCGEARHTLRVRPDRTGEVRVTFEGASHALRILRLADGELRYEADGVLRRAIALVHGAELHLAVGCTVHVFSELSPFPQRDTRRDASRALAPVAGKVTQVQVAVGDRVTEGQPMVCVEAMKMEMWLSAQAPGQVARLHVGAGDQVELDALLVELDLAAAGGEGNDTET
ncbi:acetyl/propionyl/methylcrotonyl-CoA carboxylase subunit alpha [Ramlibacter sp.]|uniref:acetyl/propionyl/methylcrotonyl-CoA carboxylase subunit alpha n=1 Tax=Ramlibacter sp. TaxID=1917967 RepID=UPI002D3C1564|nr:biotin carboxylase N-terminal domain-containing protein [Ramlibacter sp.]HYD77780.1 biotin carboxylase N-terminal domain-containing protein [Ramlibacter sp.]